MVFHVTRVTYVEFLPERNGSSCRMTRAQPISDTHCERRGNKLQLYKTADQLTHIIPGHESTYWTHRITRWFVSFHVSLTLFPVYRFCEGRTGAGRAGCGGTLSCRRSKDETWLPDQPQRPGPLLPCGREYDDCGLKCLVGGPDSIGPFGPTCGKGPGGPWT